MYCIIMAIQRRKFNKKLTPAYVRYLSVQSTESKRQRRNLTANTSMYSGAIAGTTVSRLQLLAIPSGSDKDQRIGRSIMLTGIHGVFTFEVTRDNNGAASVPQTMRVILAAKKHSKGSDDFTEGPVTNPNDYADLSQWKLYYDKTVIFPALEYESPTTPGEYHSIGNSGVKVLKIGHRFGNKKRSITGKKINYIEVGENQQEGDVINVFFIPENDRVITVSGYCDSWYKDA